MSPVSRRAFLGTQLREKLFHQAGCDLCHSPALTTSASDLRQFERSFTYHPYSDSHCIIWGRVWRMGLCKVRRERISSATAPLWGVGQRLFFLHDGRTPDLLEAIKHHSSKRFGSGRRDSQLEIAQPVADSGSAEFSAVALGKL